MAETSANWMELIVALLGGGAISTTIDRVFLRRKTDADATKTSAEGEATVAEAWQKHAENLQKEITDLRVQVDGLWRQRSECYDQIAGLNNQLANMRAAMVVIQNKFNLTGSSFDPKNLGLTKE